MATAKTIADETAAARPKWAIRPASPMTRCSRRAGRRGRTTRPCRTASEPWGRRNWPSASRPWSGRSCCRGSPSPSTGPRAPPSGSSPPTSSRGSSTRPNGRTSRRGLIQRLKALNMFLADIYGEQKILMDGVVPRDLVLGAPSYRRQMQHLYVPHSAYANVCGSDLIRRRGRRVRGAGGQSARAVGRLLHAGQPRRLEAHLSRHLPARPACGRSSAIPTCCSRP